MVARAPGDLTIVGPSGLVDPQLEDGEDFFDEMFGRFVFACTRP